MAGPIGSGYNAGYYAPNANANINENAKLWAQYTGSVYGTAPDNSSYPTKSGVACAYVPPEKKDSKGLIYGALGAAVTLCAVALLRGKFKAPKKEAAKIKKIFIDFADDEAAKEPGKIRKFFGKLKFWGKSKPAAETIVPPEITAEPIEEKISIARRLGRLFGFGKTKVNQFGTELKNRFAKPNKGISDEISSDAIAQHLDSKATASVEKAHAKAVAKSRKQTKEAIAKAGKKIEGSQVPAPETQELTQPPMSKFTRLIPSTLPLTIPEQPSILGHIKELFANFKSSKTIKDTTAKVENPPVETGAPKGIFSKLSEKWNNFIDGIKHKIAINKKPSSAEIDKRLNHKATKEVEKEVAEATKQKKTSAWERITNFFKSKEKTIAKSAKTPEGDKITTLQRNYDAAESKVSEINAQIRTLAKSIEEFAPGTEMRKNIIKDMEATQERLVLAANNKNAYAQLIARENSKAAAENLDKIAQAKAAAKAKKAQRKEQFKKMFSFKLPKIEWGKIFSSKKNSGTYATLEAAHRHHLGQEPPFRTKLNQFRNYIRRLIGKLNPSPATADYISTKAGMDISDTVKGLDEALQSNSLNKSEYTEELRKLLWNVRNSSENVGLEDAIRSDYQKLISQIEGRIKSPMTITPQTGFGSLTAPKIESPITGRKNVLKDIKESISNFFKGLFSHKSAAQPIAPTVVHEASPTRKLNKRTINRTPEQRAKLIEDLEARQHSVVDLIKKADIQRRIATLEAQEI